MQTPTKIECSATGGATTPQSSSSSSSQHPFLSSAAACTDNNTDIKAVSKKRKRDHHAEAYQNFSFAPIPSTGRPGTPHRYFAESYQVYRHSICYSTGSDHHGEDYNKPTRTGTADSCHMRVHKHANGLCVVTVGDDLISSSSSSSSSKDTLLQLTSIKMKQTAAPATSAANKRKQQSAMLRGKQKALTTPGVVRPDNELCSMLLTTGNNETRTISLPCAVWGSVLEVNPRLSVDLVQQDPFFAGYLAVILPTGPFPPRRDDGDNKKSRNEPDTKRAPSDYDVITSMSHAVMRETEN